MGATPVGFEHRHDGHDFSLLDQYAVPEPDNEEVDPILQIGESYLKQLEEGRRIQSRTVDNYLRINFTDDDQIRKGPVGSPGVGP
jgi:hypothetical protein